MYRLAAGISRIRLYLKERAMIRAYAKADEEFERYQDELESYELHR